MFSGKKFYAIDAHGFLHRAYHALPGFTTSKGVEVGAVFGFARLLIKLMREIKPDYIAVCFDSPAKTFRHHLYPEYKANRAKTDDALVSQLALAREITEGLGFKVVAGEGLEADDFMAWLGRNAAAEGLSTVLVTTDKDICQLVSDNISVWPGGKEPLRGAAYVKEKFGVPPERMADYLSIVGDSSDNVPGIRGAGPKTALALINEFGALENIIAAADAGDTRMKPKLAQSIIANRENALLSKKLVTLDAAIPLEFKLDDYVVRPPSSQTLFAMFQKYEFRDLAEMAKTAVPRVETAAGTPADEVFSAASVAVEIVLLCEGENLLLGVAGGKFCLLKRAELTAEQSGSLARLLADDKVLKISWDIKAVMHALGFVPEPGRTVNSFDTMLAAYCLNPSMPHFDFETLSVSYLGKLPPQAEGGQKLAVVCEEIFNLREKLTGELEKNSLWKLFSEMETPVASVLCGMESAGIKINKVLLQKVSSELDAVARAAESAVALAAGHDLNINSPKQLAEFLFKERGIDPVRKNKTGFSTDEEVLTQLAGEYPVAAEILKYREAVKLKTVYADNLVSSADAACRVHTFFDQTGTATGRLSSARPNLQNIPVRSAYGKEIRRAFEAEEGFVLLASDYSQIDLRVLAHESGDRALITAFEGGGDIHTQTAADVFGVMPGMVTPEMRRKAKAINFGIVYGQTGMGLSRGLDIPLSEAKAYIERYFQTYTGVREWIDRSVKQAEETERVHTMSGRVRFFPEIKGPGNAAAAAKRAAINTIVQGGSADIIKEAMLKIYPCLGTYGARMLLQIHDELLFEVPQANAAEFSAAARQVMEHAVVLKVPLTVTIKRGRNWQDMEAMPR